MPTFSTTEERIHVGRRPKPVPHYVTEAIRQAVKTHLAVTATLTPAESVEAVAGFRRARRNDPDLQLRISTQPDGEMVKVLVEVEEPAPVAPVPASKGKK